MARVSLNGKLSPGGVFLRPLVVQIDRRMVYVVDQDGREFVFHIGRDGVQENQVEAKVEPNGQFLLRVA